MQCASTIACTLNVRGVFTSTSSRNCKQTRDLKRGIRGRLCFAGSQLQAERNSSPLVSLLNNLNKKEIYKFNQAILQILKFYERAISALILVASFARPKISSQFLRVNEGLKFALRCKFIKRETRA